MTAAPEEEPSALLAMPREVLDHILSHLDAHSLCGLSLAAKAFRSFDRHSGLRLVDKIAKTAVVEAAGTQAERWRRYSWLSRLNIEDAGVGFARFNWTHPSAQPVPGQPPAYKFTAPSNPASNLHIKLEGMGPKLLVSDVSTADQPILRWRLVVRGNTAVEFGVVPLSMEDDDKSLHKCQQEEKKFERVRGPLVDAERPTGFCSSITVGSMLPFKTAIMKGSVVEMLARRGRLEVLVQNPPDGQELYWHNTRTVPKPYKGPREVRFEQDFSPYHDVKLALTSWAHGAFDVLHAAPGSRQGGGGWGPGLQPPDQASHADASAAAAVDGDSSGGQQQDGQQQDGQQEEQQQQEQQQPAAAGGSAAPSAAAAAPSAAAAAAGAPAPAAAAAAPAPRSAAARRRSSSTISTAEWRRRFPNIPPPGTDPQLDAMDAAFEESFRDPEAARQMQAVLIDLQRAQEPMMRELERWVRGELSPQGQSSAGASAAGAAAGPLTQQQAPEAEEQQPQAAAAATAAADGSEESSTSREVQL